MITTFAEVSAVTFFSATTVGVTAIAVGEAASAIEYTKRKKILIHIAAPDRKKQGRERKERNAEMDGKIDLINQPDHFPSIHRGKTTVKIWQ